jgi:hypothetical protein
MVAVVEEVRAEEVSAVLSRCGEIVVRLGEVIATRGSPRAVYVGDLDQQ